MHPFTLHRTVLGLLALFMATTRVGSSSSTPQSSLPSPLPFTLRSVSYTDHQVNINNNNVEFHVRLYDCWFDQSLYVMNQNGTVVPLASLPHHYLHRHHRSPSLQLIVAGVDEEAEEEEDATREEERIEDGDEDDEEDRLQFPVYIHRRQENIHDMVPEPPDPASSKGGPKKHVGRYIGSLEKEHLQLLHIFKSKTRQERQKRWSAKRNRERRARKKKQQQKRRQEQQEEQQEPSAHPLDTHQHHYSRTLVGPLSDRLHQFIEEETFYEDPIVHTNMLRFSRLIKIATKDDGVLYQTPSANKDMQEILSFVTVADQQQQERQPEGSQDTSTPPQGALNSPWAFVQIVNHLGQAPRTTTAFQPTHVAHSNPVHPHVTHNIVTDQKKKFLRPTKTAAATDMKYTQREHEQFISQLEMSNNGDILSPNTFIDPVIEGMLGKERVVWGSSVFLG